MSNMFMQLLTNLTPSELNNALSHYCPMNLRPWLNVSTGELLSIPHDSLSSTLCFAGFHPRDSSPLPFERWYPAVTCLSRHRGAWHLGQTQLPSENVHPYPFNIASCAKGPSNQ